MRWTWLVIAAVGAACAFSSTPAPAAANVDGRVDLPTFASPALARVAYAADPDLNGTLGWAFQLPDTSGTFHLMLTGGTTGVEDVDITFYADNQVAAATTGSFAGPGDEEGQIPSGSNYAVVTLSTGAQAAFTYTSS